MSKTILKLVLEKESAQIMQAVASELGQSFSSYVRDALLNTVNRDIKILARCQNQEFKSSLATPVQKQ